MYENSEQSILRVRRGTSWRSEQVLATLPECLEVPADLREAAVEIFENDVATEYDARHLYDFLQDDLKSWPQEIAGFLSAWLEDEENHYLGLRQLLSAVTEESQESIHSRMRQRKPDFSALEPFLDTPFEFLVALAYDERVTVQAYASDYALYDSLDASAGRWVRHANRDEATHYRNAVALLRGLYPNRKADVPGVLARLVAHDEARGPYKATFILDHDTPEYYFTAQKLRRCAAVAERTICRT
ncbi:hypothetical protein EOI86_10835 [Hwanghaeella grinnelliae]|uniref:Rubrerythrin diiron-binding domain-containing protein n=1 Tax=Hwanghaeella grinnelliae TaxID=2500179 RepID=A0A437QMJ7_9PROT|nr:ferritin family protein [Hwanghaeella grinnelliae]RVU35758.1 hypothetical protein EOI86_10835 [Hwanghaeella grinnelliae]